MRFVWGLCVVLGIGLLVWPIPESQGQWTVTVGDEAPRAVVVAGEQTASTIEVFIQSINSGVPRTDASVRTVSAVLAVALGGMGLIKAKSSSAQPAGRDDSRP